MQLQRSLPDIQRAGLGLVAVSYDSTATLRAFADKHGITFPMLSDRGSKTITAWGLLNREATGRAKGVPYPGTYVLDAKAVIVSRNFEQAYQERDSGLVSLNVEPAFDNLRADPRFQNLLERVGLPR